MLLCQWLSGKLGYFGRLLRHWITWYLAGCYINLQCSLRYWNKIFQQGRSGLSAAKLLPWVSSLWFYLCSSIQYKLCVGEAWSSSRCSTSIPSQQHQTEIFKGDQIMVLDEPSIRKHLHLDCARHHKALLVLVGQQWMWGDVQSTLWTREVFPQGITEYRVEEMVGVWRHGCCWSWRLLEIKSIVTAVTQSCSSMLPCTLDLWILGYSSDA